MRGLPMEVTMRLTPRQLQLLADARDRLAPALSLEAFAARAVAEAGDPPQPYTGAPVPPTGGAEVVSGLVQPGSAVAVELQPGESVRIEQAVGGQCADVVAWALADARERLSAAHSRARAGVSPGLGDVLWSGPPFERPLLAIVADSAPGHDLLFPACSAREYASAGCVPEPSCAGVQARAVAGYGLEMADLPDPLNLWLRASVGADGALSWHSTGTVRGDHVELLALRAVLVIVNPCVDDVFGCSGLEPRPIVVSRLPADPRTPGEPVGEQSPASPVTGRARPVARVAGPAPAPAMVWHELTVDLPGTPGGAEARAAAVRFSLAVLAESR